MGPTPPASGGPDAQPTTDGWLDPGLVNAMAGSTVRRVTVPALTPVLLLGNDAGRVAFTIVRSTAIGAMPRLSPYPDVQSFGSPEDSNTYFSTFVLQDWLSLVTGEWYAYSTSGGDVLIYEYKKHI